jgi:hypothetical protein
VYLARDPRDVAVSYYHYRKWLREYSGSESEFVRLFVAGEVDTYGRWDQHVLSWASKDPAEVLVLQFERLVADTRGCLSDAAAFLGIAAEPEAVGAAVAHHGAASMRVKERAAHAGFRTQTDPRRSFVRSARSGDWRSALSGYDVRLIEHAFGPAMARLGYQLSADGGDGHDGIGQLVGRIPGHQQRP